MNDSELLDGVQDLSLLSDRQLLERLVRATERSEGRMTVDEDYLKTAMSSLDTQFDLLRQRIDAQGQALKDAVANSTDYESLRSTVTAVADKIQADAAAMTTMAQPSAVVDPGNPAGTVDVPADPNTPIPADGGDQAPADGGVTPPVDVPADPPVEAPTDGGGDEPAPFTS